MSLTIPTPFSAAWDSMNTDAMKSVARANAVWNPKLWSV